MFAHFVQWLSTFLIISLLGACAFAGAWFGVGWLADDLEEE